jgi:hypothetical protein
MSIATKLTKLETDITNAYSAVQTKGGTIPSDKNTNNLATAISSISGGGGGDLPTGIKGIWYGSYTPSSNIPSTTGFTVTHNMGYTPTVVYCWCDTFIPIESTQSILAIVNNSKATTMFINGGITDQYGYISFNNTTKTSGGILSDSSYVGTQTTTTSEIKGNTSVRYFRAGVKYNILLIAIE